MEKNNKWKEIAENLLKLEREKSRFTFPPAEGIILQWRNEFYFGSLQKIEPEFSPEIVLLSKTTQPISRKLLEAILKIQPKRPQLIADNDLDLEGRLHILRRVGERLIKCTPEQTRYLLQRLPPKIFEL